MTAIHILILAGTRPEAIKVAPLVLQLKAYQRIRTTLVASGQHKEMLYQAFADFGIVPDMDLAVMTSGQSLASLSARLFESFAELFSQLEPDWIVVQGDTTTVMVAALCAFYHGIKIAHVEAGLRSFRMDAPFPEELNRRVAGLVADLHFAPTTGARENLLREHVPAERLFVTGNTVIDALYWIRQHGGSSNVLLPPVVAAARQAGMRLILVTGHRRENLGKGFESICLALQNIVQRYTDVAVIYPVHLNPHVRSTVLRFLGGHERILLTDPVPYKSFVALMDAAHIILTDSGGVQEEGPALGKPVLVMRDVTERPEGVAAGTARLVGAQQEGIINALSNLLDHPEEYAAMAHAVNPYGDGHAAERICDVLLSFATQPQ